MVMAKVIKRLLILLVILFPSYAFSAVDPGIFRLSLADGDVQVYTQDAGEWVPASINMPVMEGDRLWVPEDGRAEIQARGGAYIRLDGGTALDLLSLEEDATQFYQDSGYTYINNRRGGIGHIQVETPLSSVSIYDNSIVMIDVSKSGATEVSVLKGYAYAETRSGKTRITAGNSLYIGEDLYAELSPIGPPDEWEKWNRKRDRRLSELAESSRYLPEDLDAYSSDFDEGGRWVYAAPYGYVWSPSLTISVGWAPYRHGRWVWVGGHYTWISYEPWGWVPYHYGRWSFVARIGWCWVPPVRGDIYWGPGYVGWVYDPGYAAIAWVPLAPGEIYYGYGYYGASSVNIVNINIQKTVIHQEFRNVSVRNAVTVISRDTFLTGRETKVSVKGNPFLKAKANIGPPDIKPQRATMIPVIKKIKPSKQPPEKLRSVRLEAIKKERVILKDKESSVFSPGKQRQAMPLRESKEPAKVIKREIKPSREGTKAAPSVSEPKEERRKIEIAPSIKEKKAVEQEKGRAKTQPVPSVQERKGAPEKEVTKVRPAPSVQEGRGAQEGEAGKGRLQTAPLVEKETAKKKAVKKTPAQIEKEKKDRQAEEEKKQKEEGVVPGR
jgi:hypothetical protein